jgi:HTH-type transcriptional regulator/antitoxin HigA
MEGAAEEKEITSMKTTTKAYEKLIKRFPLRPIRTDEDNDAAAEICDELTDRLDTLSDEQKDYLEILSDLIIKYESKWNDELPPMPPRKLLLYLLDHNNLARKDLVPEFGSESRVSEYLSGKRDLSKEQAKALSKRFSIRLDALLE